MSNSARRKLGLEAEKVQDQNKNENLPLHDLHLGQDVMMQDPASKQWSPVVITRLCKEPRSYQVTTKRQCDLQKDAITSETLQARNQEFARCEKLKYVAT